MTQTQFDTFVIFAFNVGVKAFSGSTVVKRFNAGHSSVSVMDALKWWNKITVNGKTQTIKGLVNRRQKEADLFLEGRYVGIS